MLTDSTNTVVWEGVYKPFGEAEVNPNSSVVNNFRFPGQYYDTETGLHYNYFRYYDPSTGRYLTPDPIGIEGGINLYTYTSNNPVNLVDSLGLCENEERNLFEAGTWTSNTTFSAPLGQIVWIRVTNVNVLGTTISIESLNTKQVQQLILIPYIEKEFRFSVFGSEPISWDFRIRTESDVFSVNYVIESTWVPGMPPNR